MVMLAFPSEINVTRVYVGLGHGSTPWGGCTLYVFIQGWVFLWFPAAQLLTLRNCFCILLRGVELIHENWQFFFRMLAHDDVVLQCHFC
uniref:Uncharacterized protein n=1 Tax=Aegilops tauschii subsp. strangulata TaxID=200361 RepID=A0A453SM72_AEGTS